MFLCFFCFDVCFLFFNSMLYAVCYSVVCCLLSVVWFLF